MENNEKSQIEFFMQNLSDNMDKLSKQIDLIPLPAPIEKHLTAIKNELIKLFENDQKIVKKIQAFKIPKTEPSINKSYKVNHYSIFQASFFKKHKKKILILTTIFLLLPSVFFFFKKEAIERKHQNYKIFYEYIYLVSLENKNEKNVADFETLLNKIKNQDAAFFKKYNQLKKMYLIY